MPALDLKCQATDNAIIRTPFTMFRIWYAVIYISPLLFICRYYSIFWFWCQQLRKRKLKIPSHIPISFPLVSFSGISFSIAFLMILLKGSASRKLYLSSQRNREVPAAMLEHQALVCHQKCTQICTFD